MNRESSVNEATSASGLASVSEPGPVKQTSGEKSWIGYVMVAIAAFCWASSANFAKAAFAGHLLRRAGPVAVLTVTQMRSTVSFLLLLPAMLLLRGYRGTVLPWRDALACMALGAVGVAGANYFYYSSITHTTVATAIVVQYLSPVYVLCIQVALRQERFTRNRVVSVLLAVAGCLLVVGLGSGVSLRANRTGILLAQAAAFAFTIYNVGGGWLAGRVDALRLMLFAMAGAALLWLPLQPPTVWVAHHYSAWQWGEICGLAVFSMLLPYTLYFAALTRLDATRAIVTSCLEPVFAALIAWGLLGEVLRPLQAAGVGVVVLATILAQKRMPVTVPDASGL